MTEPLDPSAFAAALAVALPLAGALAALVMGRRAGDLIVVTGPAMALVAAALVAGVAENGPARIAVGGFAPPLGIALVADGLAATFVATTLVVMVAALAFARGGLVARLRETRRGYAFVALAHLAWGALNAVFLAGDLFNLYVALELLSLAAIGLVALEGKAETLAAAIRYAFFALTGSLLYLAGAVLLYSTSGTLDIALLGARAPEGTPTLVAGALMTAGLCAKTALFPLHAWLPPAHAGAPAPASAILSGLVPKASFVVLARLWLEALPGAAGPALGPLLGGLGAAAILYGSVLALRQERLKLLVAYSTIAQIGYLFLLFPLAGGALSAQPWAAGAWSGALLHGVSHALAKAALFLAAGLVLERLGHDRIAGLSGLARAMPMTAFAIGLSAVTLMGLPPSGGFIAKYLLLVAAFASGEWAWGVVLLGGGLLSALYLFPVLGRLFAREGAGEEGAPKAEPTGSPPSRAREAIPLLLAGLAIALGFASAWPTALLAIGRPGAATVGLE
ncbi:MAG: complex I subunit 5 family protein [Salinarimonas sp.]